MSTVFWCVLAVVVIILLIYMITVLPIFKYGTLNQTLLAENFDNINDENIGEAAIAVLNGENNIVNPNPADLYRVGVTYLLNMHDPVNAHDRFTQALLQVRENPGQENNLYYVDRITDFNEMFTDVLVNDLPLQQALEEIFMDNNTTIEAKARNWTPDNHNVHDTSVNDGVKEHYAKIKKLNSRMEYKPEYSYQAAKEMVIRNSADKDKIAKIFDRFNNDHKIKCLDSSEQELIGAVYQRMHAPENKNNFNELRQALCDAINDCGTEAGTVCQHGRISRIIASLAILDAEPSMGILKTKQLARTEIYNTAGKIVSDAVAELKIDDKKIYDDYINDVDSSEVLEFKNSLEQDIEKIRKDYVKNLPADQLNLILKECKETI